MIDNDFGRDARKAIKQAKDSTFSKDVIKDLFKIAKAVRSMQRQHNEALATVQGRWVDATEAAWAALDKARSFWVSVNGKVYECSYGAKGGLFYRSPYGEGGVPKDFTLHADRVYHLQQPALPAPPAQAPDHE